jgi:anti-sigma B factor antagonist
MADPAARLSIDRTPGGLILAGEIDAHTAPLLSGALDDLARDTTWVTIDMADVSFIDSSGLRVVVSALNDLTAAGGSLRIQHPSTAVARLVELSGLDHLVARADDAERPGATVDDDVVAEPNEPA